MQRRLFLIFSLFIILLSPLALFAQQFSLLKDISPGNTGSTYFNLTNVNGILFFRPDDGVHGDELWKTDGTEAGTTLIKDINPGSAGSGLDLFTNVNGVLFFRADDGIHGTEIWKSDGTEAGTILVKDIKTGPGSSSPAVFFSSNGLLFFSAIDDSHGAELWKSDGTEAGTVMIKDIFTGVANSGLGAGSPNSGNPSDFTLLNGFVYFAASDATGNNTRKLWRTDGTSAGTDIVKDVSADTFPLYNLINVNGVLFFTVYRGQFNELWKSDGTKNGTVFVKETNGFNAFTSPVALNGSLYFSDGGLWKSDGTEAGTVLLKDRDYSYPYSPELLTSINGLIYFTGYDATNGWELWKSDGTLPGTVLVKDINPGPGNSNINAFAKVGNQLMFSANNTIHGNEIWVSNGTANGTKLVQDIAPGNASALQTLDYQITGSIVEANGKIFAGATTEEFGTEVWVADVVSEVGLPLNLLEFKGSIVNTDGLLHWKTDNETNTASFIIERSIDGRTYKSIGSVAAANSPGIHYYDFTDANITALGITNFYYRLKQTDLDGKYVYSNIVVLSVSGGTNFVMLYPNPAIDRINMTIHVSQKEKMQWQLMDNMGRRIKTGSYDLLPGSLATSIDIAALSAGVYLIQLNSSSLQKVIKFVKQ